LIFENGLLAEDGMLVLEHGNHKSFESHERFERAKNYGKIVFSFFQ